ncbi:MAG: 4-hydroxy-3-methylbut-2-enyl diphosphate reductase [Bdellovibrionales bacterium]|nr:4-hydroxy-3-methylbut-2-enyl diphosphate reductase [Bdellovibrionales bacterium]
MKLHITLANPRGFCAGVNMAIECLDMALRKFGAPVYVYHEIVHNRHVVEDFGARGAVFVQKVEEVPEKGVLLYSAHGVSPAVRKAAQERKLFAIDATCPLVTKVHMEAVRFARDGYHILLIGHAGHDEVIGTMGEAPASTTLVQTLSDVEALEFSPSSKLAYLTQTTLSVDDASKRISALRNRFPQIEGPKREDICYATQNRQEAVRLLSEETDLVLVLGSQNSSNSQRLAEIARSQNKRAFLIDSAAEILPEWLQGTDRVLITAGASAPEKVVQECIERLSQEYGGTVTHKVIREENVHFAIPKELRDEAT